MDGAQPIHWWKQKNWQQYNIISCIHHYRKGKETGVKMSPAVVSGIVIGDATVSYLPIFFPVRSNSLKSLCKSYFFKMANCHTGMLPPVWHFFFNLSDTCSSEVWKEIKTISTLVSPGEMCLYGPLSSSSGWVLWVRTMFTFPGMIKLKICLPVHRGLGFRIAGCGILPSQSGIHIIRFIIVSWR